MVVALRRLVEPSGRGRRGRRDGDRDLRVDRGDERLDEEMASTSQDLSRRAGNRRSWCAPPRRRGADSPDRRETRPGADEAASRNADLSARRGVTRTDWTEHVRLAKLADEVAKGARSGVVGAGHGKDPDVCGPDKAVATQTNMLALNAAIEAARAGPQVADSPSSRRGAEAGLRAAAAAGETADTVRGVLNACSGDARPARAAGRRRRGRARSIADGRSGVGDRGGRRSMRMTPGPRDRAVGGELRSLVEEIANRLGTIAGQTDTLLASAEELAASGEEQSASTEEMPPRRINSPRLPTASPAP